jgi:5-methylcytosine-specific restriction endonuclease McrA
VKLKDLLELEYITKINENKYKCNKCGKKLTKLGIINHHYYNHEEDGIEKKKLLRKKALIKNNTTEMKKKISERTNKAYKRDDVKRNFQLYVKREKIKRIGRGNPMYGKHHTNEWKQNHSNFMKTFQHTAETKEQLKQINLGKKHSPESIKKMRIVKLGKKDSAETKLKKSISNIGRKHSAKTKNKLRLAKIGKLNPRYGKYRTIEYIKKKYPFFSRIEEMRYNPDKPGEKEIQVHCKNHLCENSKEKGGWFTPTYIQLYERIRNLEKEYGNDGAYFYCSQECKNVCPLFNLYSDPYKETKKQYTELERKQFNDYVLERDNNQCQYCGEKAEHVHHERPVKLEPFFALDPDYAWSVCKKCHYKYGHKDECSTSNIAKMIC